MSVTRRSALGLLGAGSALVSAGVARAGERRKPGAAQPDAAPPNPAEPKYYDRPGLEWVMDIVPICSGPEFMGPPDDFAANDGKRDVVWPITGGYFVGKGIKGIVIPGGGDFPVLRPDGVDVVDALYRLKTDDGVQIIIHNKGLGYTQEVYRLLPSFTVSGKKYGWLRESVFVATLTYPVPPEYDTSGMKPGENGRLIQVYRLV